MTTASCHFLPLSAAENIPSCNISKRRNKRFVDSIISLVVGGVSLGISASNTAQIGKLLQQVALVENSLSKFSQTEEIHRAQLAKLTLKYIELTEELKVTQEALNQMVPVLNTHSAAINILKTGPEQLHARLRHSFLYLAIIQISRNDLTLDFLSPEDIHKVVYNVMKRGNLTFNSYPGSLPVVQIITKLLVRQQIEFVPKSRYKTDDIEEIGRLVITSFFRCSTTETNIFLYLQIIVTIPFYYENETIQLAQISRYWAIDTTNNTTMEWHHPEESGCDLRLMTSCRDTPPLHTISKDTCLDQIIGKLLLSRCQTTPIPAAKYFLRKLRNNFWITSSHEPIHYVKTPSTEHVSVMQQTWSMSEEIMLSSVAFVNVTKGYTVACPGFTLVGRPIT
jgi:hypothetical protein